MARIKRNRLGFQQAFEYILDLFCYAYYVKHTHFVSDQTFDDLEKFYCMLQKEVKKMLTVIVTEFGLSTIS
jgi:hypothetical protein